MNESRILNCKTVCVRILLLNTIYSIILLSILLVGNRNLSAANGPMMSAVKNVKDFYSSSSPTSGIQEAIDALPKEGGLVIVPPGIYLLKCSIMLPDNTTLRGSGPASVLIKCAGFQTRMVEKTPAGSLQLKVANVDGFEKGMQICITSKDEEGWYCSQPVITRIDGTMLYLSEPLEKNYDVATSIVISYFPAIWLRNRKNIVIENITINGDLKNNEDTFSDFVCAAIHSERSVNVSISGCDVRDWPGDGIGVQGGTDIFVNECRVTGCRGHGFHPGTSIRNAVFSNLVSHNNTKDGLYFCADVQHISVTNGIFSRNGMNGIGGLGGGRWPDSNNIVSNNVCESNNRCGIEGTEGSNFVVSNNICRNNSRGSSGRFPGILLQNCSGMIVTGNLCHDDREDDKKTQKFGIEETGKSDNNIITSNICRGNIVSGIKINGERTRSKNNTE